MDGIFKQIKREVIEYHLYAVLIGGDEYNYLYACVAPTLEEAYKEAKQTFIKELKEKGEEDGLKSLMALKMWFSVPVSEVVIKSLRPQAIKVSDLYDFMSLKNPEMDKNISSMLSDFKKTVAPKTKKEDETRKENSNDLIKKLIKEGDINKVKRIKKKLTSAEKKYIIDTIQSNKNNRKK